MIFIGPIIICGFDKNFVKPSIVNTIHSILLKLEVKLRESSQIGKLVYL